MKIKVTVCSTFFLISFIFCLVLSVSAQNLTVREIMAEPSIAGQRVEGEKLSPDGTKVIFLWNAEGKLPRDLYMVPATGGTPQIILRVSDLPSSPPRVSPENKLDYGLIVRDDFVKAREVGLGNFEWSPDSKRLLFTQAGDLYVFTLVGGKPKRYTKTQAAEVGARFIDNDRILYQQSGNIFVLNISDATTVQLTREADPARFISVGGVTASKDGKMLAYTVSDSSKFRQLFVPNYLGEFTDAPTFRRGWSEQKLFVVPTDGSRDFVSEVKVPKQEGVGGFRRTAWTADGRSLIVDRVDKDTKRRQLFYVYNVGSKDEKLITISDETDDKWQASLSVIFEPNPKDPSQLFFCSEKDGYNHIYLAKLEAETRVAGSVPDPSARVQEGSPGLTGKVTIKQLTKGNWQVEWAKWTAGGSNIAYSSTEESADERQFYLLNTASGEKFKLQSYEKGMKISAQMDEVNPVPTLLYSFSQWQTPDELYAQKVCDACKVGEAVNRLTITVPAAFDARKWNAPRFVDIPSRDGKKIPSKYYLPADFDPKKKYPMVIFVHGAGYLQNTINGWNNYYREFMFNDLLTRRGYVVLDIDYRGSAGYGRDWRTDVYDFLGGKDYDDHIDAIDFMVKNYAVDPNKVGVYGGSYGGFMAEMLIFRAPDKVAAAAALRPVADWKNYYASSPTYTAQRLGFPDKNPEAYKRSSPISYADKLQKPLLILHGMVDDNVHVQDSQQLIEKLIRLGKTQYFEAMLYPSENHGFVRPESWADEYERILSFFEKHLK